jgi:hypothetical protein
MAACGQVEKRTSQLSVSLKVWVWLKVWLKSMAENAIQIERWLGGAVDQA